MQTHSGRQPELHITQMAHVDEQYKTRILSAAHNWASEVCSVVRYDQHGQCCYVPESNVSWLSFTCLACIIYRPVYKPCVGYQTSLWCIMTSVWDVFTAFVNLLWANWNRASLMNCLNRFLMSWSYAIIWWDNNMTWWAWVLDSHCAHTQRANYIFPLQVFSHWHQKSLHRTTQDMRTTEGMSLLVFDASGKLDQVYSCSSYEGSVENIPAGSKNTSSQNAVACPNALSQEQQDILERQEREWSAWWSKEGVVSMISSMKPRRHQFMYWSFVMHYYTCMCVRISYAIIPSAYGFFVQYYTCMFICQYCIILIEFWHY